MPKQPAADEYEPEHAAPEFDVFEPEPKPEPEPEPAPEPAAEDADARAAEVAGMSKEDFLDLRKRLQRMWVAE